MPWGDFLTVIAQVAIASLAGMFVAFTAAVVINTVIANWRRK
jgi:hypothetical protein